MSALGPGLRLIEPGSGTSAKTRILLDAMQPPASYVCVDISRSHLMTAARALTERYPGIEILPVCADFTQPFEIPAGTTADRIDPGLLPGLDHRQFRSLRGDRAARDDA